MWCFFCPPHRLFTDLGPWDIKSSPHPIEFLAERRRGVWKWLKAFSSWEGIKGRLEIVDRRTALWLFSLGPLGPERRIRGVRSQREDKVTDWAEAAGQHWAAESNSVKDFPPNYYQIYNLALSTLLSSWMQYTYYLHMCTWRGTYTVTEVHAHTWTHMEPILVVVENEQ